MIAMLTRRQFFRRLQYVSSGSNICIWCQGRKLFTSPKRGYATARKAPRRVSITEMKRDPDLLRAHSNQERRKRMQNLTIAFKDGAMTMEPATAESVILQYEKKGLQRILDLYDLETQDVTHLALILTKISPMHRQLAHQMLVDCSMAKDAEATLHLLAAINRAQVERRPNVNLSGMEEARPHLEELAYNEKNTEAMVLLGQFLEAEGKSKDAITLYRLAMDILAIKKDGFASPVIQANEPNKHPLPLVAPWIALGNILMTRQKDLEGARDIFIIGALKADDPMAYYRLAQLTDPNTVEWLEYTTKAAASGHPDAAYDLGNFYMQPKAETGITWTQKLQQHLRWLDTFHPVLDQTMKQRPSDARRLLALEWFRIAARSGHKPSLLVCAANARTLGLWQQAASDLVTVLQKPPPNVPEQYPKEFREAQKLLKVWLEEDEKAGDEILKKEYEKMIPSNRA